LAAANEDKADRLFRDCEEFCVRGRFTHHAAKNLHSKMMANWVFAATITACIFHVSSPVVVREMAARLYRPA